MNPDDQFVSGVNWNLNTAMEACSTVMQLIQVIVIDFISFGFENDGVTDSGERVANQIIRIELEETGDNTSTFEGNLSMSWFNQINILDAYILRSFNNWR